MCRPFLSVMLRKYLLDDHGNTNGDESKCTQNDDGPLLVSQGLPVLPAAHYGEHFGRLSLDSHYGGRAKCCTGTEWARQFSVTTMPDSCHTYRILCTGQQIVYSEKCLNPSVKLEKRKK
ncbi:hypothetical protein AVEN_217572-1 [Araneus ventricosus]|uniref:Uncharacterized protein n=1 Tax=Araneus ventricosus TaxID=182803 RepID=A0A4Y2KY67_ARAVE|nr:hypothetical protein AVEN_217572-1 [Araneus ventricosus]